jgi:DNA-binding IclR family transcriptional regulator
MCVEFLPALHELQALVFVGQRSPLYSGASAKALLAFLPDEEIDHILATESIQKMTANTLTNKEEIWREVRQIRKQGYAISNQERVEGAFSISFPIFNMEKRVVASLTITIPTVRVKEGDLPRYIRALKETAGLISYEMGYREANVDAGLSYKDGSFGR